MSNGKSFFISIRKLLTDGLAVGEVKTAIQGVGFFALDGCGRFVHISPTQTGPDTIAKFHTVIELLERWFNETIEATINGGHDPLDLVNSGEDLLDYCGWMSERLPDFEGLQRQWYEYQLDQIPSPNQAEAGPGKNSKVWRLLDTVLTMQYGSELVEDLKSQYSRHASRVCRDLEKAGLKMDSKTLKKHLQNAG